ncbi:MAG: VOC family protein, partial [Gaiellales bacterium]
MITVEHVDFISIPTQDVPRAKRFYGELLGLELERDTPAGAEYRAGQVTLGIWAP